MTSVTSIKQSKKHEKSNVTNLSNNKTKLKISRNEQTGKLQKTTNIKTNYTKLQEYKKSINIPKEGKRSLKLILSPRVLWDLGKITWRRVALRVAACQAPTYTWQNRPLNTTPKTTSQCISVKVRAIKLKQKAIYLVRPVYQQQFLPTVYNKRRLFWNCD